MESGRLGIDQPYNSFVNIPLDAFFVTKKCLHFEYISYFLRKSIDTY